jgi:prepilin-type N-terminal cleavage/methylation domain-containing protein
MKMKLQVESCKLLVFRPKLAARKTFNLQPLGAVKRSGDGSTFNRQRAFTLIEVLVVMTLLALIVLSLMTVLNNTQTAFRAGITQTDVLESGRAVTDLLKSDLEGMTPSFGTSNGAVNFYANTNFSYTPLVQALPGGTQTRASVLENFFILSRQNINGSPSWVGTGYMVVTNSLDGLYSLYRFSTNFSVMVNDPAGLFYTSFNNFFLYPTNYSHLMNGVVGLTVRAYDPNGFWMTNTVDFYGGQFTTNQNTIITNQNTIYMYSNAVPASVEVELGVLEDRTLQRAESLPLAAQTNYLALHAGQVHIFRQRVWIRNVDPSAYHQ